MPAISIDDIAFVEGDLSNQVKEKLGFMQICDQRITMKRVLINETLGCKTRLEHDVQLLPRTIFLVAALEP